jgi:hypothetical protein
MALKKILSLAAHVTPMPCNKLHLQFTSAPPRISDALVTWPTRLHVQNTCKSPWEILCKELALSSQDKPFQFCCTVNANNNYVYVHTIECPTSNLTFISCHSGMRATNKYHIRKLNHSVNLPANHILSTNSYSMLHTTTKIYQPRQIYEQLPKLTHLCIWKIIELNEWTTRIISEWL